MARKWGGRRSAKPNRAVGIATSAAFDDEGKPKPAVQRMLLRAVEVQRPLVLANLRRLRKKYPDASAYDLGKRLEKDYLRAVGGGGAAIGATAIVPGIGTVVSLSISAAAVVVFLETTALYAQSVAELHGIRLLDPERAQVAVMAIILGEEGTSLLEGFTSHAHGATNTPLHAWGSAVSKGLPLPTVKTVAAQMRKRFLKKIAVRTGTTMMGKAIPFGIGAVVGGAGNYMMGKAVVASTRQAFGPAPLVIPAELDAELEAPRQKKSVEKAAK